MNEISSEDRGRGRRANMRRRRRRWLDEAGEVEQADDADDMADAEQAEAAPAQAEAPTAESGTAEGGAAVSRAAEAAPRLEPEVTVDSRAETRKAETRQTETRVAETLAVEQLPDEEDEDEPSRALAPAADKPLADTGKPVPGFVGPGQGQGFGRRAARQAAIAAAAAISPVQVTTRPMAKKARMRLRHWLLLLSFVMIVVIPTGVAAWYLWEKAVDQYASTVGFSVRKEETSSSMDVLGGLTQLTQASSSDTDVLYSFIQSQELVARVDEQLDLDAIYGRHAAEDPVFSLAPGGTIEDLVDYWQRMVTIYYDPATGLIAVRALAFDPAEAKAIADAIFVESSNMINRLSAIAREDATRYARADLDEAIERLKAARAAVTEFRNRTQIVDPAADVQGQVGLLNQLQTQLAEALIESDMLRSTVKAGDPRLVQAERRIEVIQQRITAERRKFGAGVGTAEGGETGGPDDYALVVAEFERLTVDLQVAEQQYKSALVGYDAAVAEAQRQSRYLAAHINPTVAQSSRFPERGYLLGLLSLFLFLTWSILTLIYYSLRDRH